MDPLGFGLENFDAVGAWRTMDGKFPIDAPGTLPDGREFNGPEELRDDPARPTARPSRGALTAKLLTYALGRGLERYDTTDGQGDRRAGCRRSDYGSRRWSWRSSTACRSSRGGAQSGTREPQRSRQLP